MKLCKGCNTEKEVKDFYLYPNGNPESQCKECRKRRSVEVRRRNPKAYNNYQREWRQRNPGYMKEMQKYYRDNAV